jgi:hypothetical protein
MTNGKVIPTDLYDDDGNMVGIEFNDTSGNFVIEAGWDHRDEQTSENRIKFREWAYRFITKNLEYEVLK